MLQDKAGNRLVRRVNIKIHYPDGILPVQKIVQKAEAKKGFSADAIDEILMSVTDMLDTRFPFWEFRMQELASRPRVAEYVFTQIGYRAVVPSAETPPAKTEALKAIERIANEAQAAGDYDKFIPPEETNAPTVV